ncbi:MAG: hypothetical protein HY288_02845 [Planctomycetia bacterium]|nr:hypothetical protein [Planctomycetia bacterium]
MGNGLTSLLVTGVVIACQGLAAGQDWASVPPRLLGPMIGHVTPAEATIWLSPEMAGVEPEVIVQFRSAADPPDRVQAIRVKPNPAAGTSDTPGAFYKFSWGEVDFFPA